MRSIYGLPALLDGTNGDKTAAGSSKSAAEEKEGGHASPLAAEKTWPVPPLGYHHVGIRVVLLMRLEGNQLRLKAVEVPGDKFSQLLFCRVAVHRRTCYSERVQELVGYNR